MLNTNKLIAAAIECTLHPFIINTDLVEFVYAYQQMVIEELETYGLTISQLGVNSNAYHIFMIWGVTWGAGEKFIRLVWDPDGKNGGYEIYDRNPQ